MDVVVQWNKSYKDVISEIESGVKDQVVCFFRLCEGAKLGTLIVGRKGSQTRLDIFREELEFLISGDFPKSKKNVGKTPEVIDKDDEKLKLDEFPPEETAIPKGPETIREASPKSLSLMEKMKKVYITHGKNRDFIDPIRELLSFGELEAIASIRENPYQSRYLRRLWMK